MTCPHCNQPIPDADVLSEAGSIRSKLRKTNAGGLKGLTTEQRRANARKMWRRFEVRVDDKVHGYERNLEYAVTDARYLKSEGLSATVYDTKEGRQVWPVFEEERKR